MTAPTTPKRPVGRPREPGARAHGAQLHLKVTREEAEAIRAAAARRGLSVTEFLVRLVVK